ncbi:MAG: hypothetical protein BGO69_18505 [Bacteroidetes bacterium 46-16]|nr:MAG: hypothetical protein BGO69_18505 [Bacteroidetes bacterium 46-16]
MMLSSYLLHISFQSCIGHYFTKALLVTKPLQKNNTMGKVINISYKLSTSDQLITIPVSYVIENNEDMYTITCTVNPGNSLLPFWLQRKFNIKLLFTDGYFIHLFDESNIIKNLDTSLFIDQVYDSIITKEKLREVPA